MLRCILALSALVVSVSCHGRVLNPPSRASAWRYGFPTLPNYDDDGLNCGGFYHQYEVNGGKCGICGDPFDQPLPRKHELGGVYGDGIIVEHYKSGQVFSATVQITASHRGYWEFKICPDPNSNDQKCFDQYPLELEGGGTKYYPKREARYTVDYRLPPGLVCEHCVLQWKYTAGNNWGRCSNGTEGLGCGNQEQFGACTDISIGIPIVNADEPSYPLSYFQRLGYLDTQVVEPRISFCCCMNGPARPGKYHDLTEYRREVEV